MNPYDLPETASQHEPIDVHPATRLSNGILRFGLFFCGAAVALWISNWMLGNTWVIKELKKDPILAVFLAFLVSVVPFGLTRLCLVIVKQDYHMPLEFLSGLLCVGVTNVLAHYLQAFVPGARYAGVCFVFLVPVSIFVTLAACKFRPQNS